MRRRFPGAYDSCPRLPLRETDDQQTLLSRMPHDQLASLIRRVIRIVKDAGEWIREYRQCLFERDSMLLEIPACLRCVPLELRRRRSAHRRCRNSFRIADAGRRRPASADFQDVDSASRRARRSSSLRSSSSSSAISCRTVPSGSVVGWSRTRRPFSTRADRGSCRYCTAVRSGRQAD